VVKRSQNDERSFQLVSGWQRFPSEFALAGWLRPEHPRSIPHAALSTLLAVYGQLLERNLQQSPKLTDRRVELDEMKLALDAGVEDVGRELDLLVNTGLLVRGVGSNVEVQDPISVSWPPPKFATLPARFVVEQLPQLRAACVEQKIDFGDALALYVVMLAQRNSKTGEIWYSTVRTPERAGLDSKRAELSLGALMQVRLIRRPTLSRIWVYQISGLEPSGANGPPFEAPQSAEQSTHASVLRGQRRSKTKVKSPLGKKPAP
jgi:hypothetical protein